MRISLAIVFSAMLAPAVLAGPFVPVQHQQDVSASEQGTFAGVVSYIRNAMKMSSLQRRDIEKDIDAFEQQQQVQYDSSVEASSQSISYVVHQDGPNYIYEQVDPASMVIYEISHAPEPSFVYYAVPSISSLSSEVPQSTTPSAQNKVQISDDDYYFSQTDSYNVPDLASLLPDSPFIRDWPEIPDEAPPKIRLPVESSLSV